jgi:hypothetical protein
VNIGFLNQPPLVVTPANPERQIFDAGEPE